MSHAHCGQISRLAFFHNSFPLCCIPRTVLNPAIHGQDSLVDWLNKVLSQVLSPSLRLSSALVTPVLLPSRRASFCSTYTSGEDVTTALVSSQVDDRQSMGILASPLLPQKREACAAPARIYHSIRNSSMSGSYRITSAGRPVAMYSHTQKSSRDPRSVQETHAARERILTEHQEVRADEVA